MQFIQSNWKLLAGGLIVFLIGLSIYLYGNSREDAGYTQGARDSTAVWSERYQALVGAKTRTDSLLTIEREKLPPVIIRWRDRSNPDAATRAQVDSAYREGIAQGIDCQEQLYRMATPATLEIDTTQLTKDSLQVRTTGLIQYYPLSREFFASIQAAPVITRTWMIKSGYILPPEIVRYNWAFEVMAGSSVRGTPLRFSPSVWLNAVGVGADFEANSPPVLKIGGRYQF